MPRFCYFIETTRKGWPTVEHKVSIPLPAEQGFYRAVSSFNSFAHAPQNSYKKQGCCFRDDVFFRMMRDWEREMEQESLKKAFPDYQPPKTIEHESIWAFYDYVGYDYKRKRTKSPPDLLSCSAST